MTKQANQNTRFALTLTAAAALTLAAAPIASAKKYGSDYNGNVNDTVYDTAKVVGVDPIYESYEVNEPIRHCWTERVPVRNSYSDKHYKSKSKTPMVVGAIIGGLVGNQIAKRGGGNARDIGTVAGAVLGGSIGRDVKHRNDYERRDYRDRHHVRYETVEQCEVRDNYVSKQSLVGYDVAYKYRGNVFHTTMDRDPGSKIKVRVTVDPV